jgi:hypothetical protein
MESEDIQDHYREGTRSHFDSTVGDDLCRIADEREHLRDFLLGLCRFRKIDEETLRYLACAEEAVQEILLPRWSACQESLSQATEEELSEMDTTWMGRPIPDHFSSMTVVHLQVAIRNARDIRVPTNPANYGGQL